MDLSLPAWAASAVAQAASAAGGALGLAGASAAEGAAQVGQAVGRAGHGLDTAQLLAIAAALGWASGLRLYAVLFLTGLAGRLGWVPLPEGLLPLQHGAVLGATGLLLVAEFFADKLPWLDSLWDAVHTVIRIPAGAALTAAALGADGATAALLTALLGGTLAATAHVAKAGTRAAVNTSPEPFSNLALSLAGDAAVPTVLWLSWSHPLLCLALLAVAVAGMLLLIGLTFGALRRLLRRPLRRPRPAPRTLAR